MVLINAAKALGSRLLSPSRKPYLRSAIGGLIVTLSFGYLGYTLVRNWGQLASYEWHINYYQIIWIFISYSLSLALAVLGWGLILSHFTEIKSPRKHLKYYIYTNLLRRVPVPWLYFFGRVYLYEREGITKSVMATVSLLEYILLVLSGIVVYLLTLPFLPQSPTWRSWWFLAGILIVGGLLLHPRMVQMVLRLLGQRELSAPFGYNNVLLWLIIYSLVWIGGGLTLYAVANSIYILPLACLPTVIGAWVLSGVVTMLIFVTSAGLGLKELTLSLLLSYIMPFSLAVVVTLLTRICLVLLEIAWGIVALRL